MSPELEAFATQLVKSLESRMRTSDSGEVYSALSEVRSAVEEAVKEAEHEEARKTRVAIHSARFCA